VAVHLAAMEGHSECVRYLVQQQQQQRQQSLDDQLVAACRITPSSSRHQSVLGVTNNLGETARALAERFLKHDAVDTIDRLLAPLTASTDDRNYTPSISRDRRSGFYEFKKQNS